jgi:hypothetical protein
MSFVTEHGEGGNEGCKSAGVHKGPQRKAAVVGAAPNEADTRKNTGTSGATAATIRNEATTLGTIRIQKPSEMKNSFIVASPLGLRVPS